MRKNVLLILAVSIILLTIIIAYSLNSSSIFAPSIPSKPRPLISIGTDPQNANVTQGMSFAVNLTITSMAEKEFSIPLNLTLYIIRNSTGWQGLPEEVGFTFSFNPDLLILEPYGSNSSLLSVTIAENAPVGEYQFSVETGNWEETHVGGTTIIIDVNPK
jgi:hypothetical protein